ncbi:MAG: sensor histidine kinase [Alphaproteobacteria bacterium]
MWFYRTLDRLPFPRSYIGKILAVSFVGVHVPLICLIAYLVTAAGLSTEAAVPILVVSTLATVAGTGLTFLALFWLMAPMREASRSIHDYLAHKLVPTLPTSHGDQAGRLLRDVQEGITRLDLALDQAEAARQTVMVESRGKFQVLSKLSHEFRTPLNAIIGFSEVMEGEMLGPLGAAAYKGYAGDIHASGNSLALQLQSLLDLSQLEAGGFEMDVQDVRVDEHIRQAIGLKHLHAQSQGLSLVATQTDLPIPFRCDPSLLKQALLNLMSASILSTEAGGAVSVTCRRDGAAVELVVSDTGRPLDGEDLSPGLGSGQRQRAGCEPARHAGGDRQHQQHRAASADHAHAGPDRRRPAGAGQPPRRRQVVHAAAGAERSRRIGVGEPGQGGGLSRRPRLGVSAPARVVP